MHDHLAHNGAVDLDVDDGIRVAYGFRDSL